MVRSICLFCIFFLLLNFPGIKAQNLIQNGSFEKTSKSYNYYHYEIDGIKMVKFWINPNKGTPDYFHQKEKNKDLRFKKYKHDEEIKFGEACVGIYNSVNNRREYVQAKLTTTLESGKIYCFSVYVFTRSNYSSNISNFGAYFSSEKIKNKEPYDSFFLTPQASCPVNPMLEEKKWVKVSASYKAKGGERFITIGCFVKPSKKIRGSNSSKESCNCPGYLFIDEVSLIPVANTTECECTQQEPTISSAKEIDTIKTDTATAFEVKLGEALVLQDVFFETAKWDLLETSFSSLNKVLEYLKKNDKVRVEISGHTDNVGKEEDNLKLSQNRAKAVVDYFKANGIAENRLSYKGYGSSQPITDNSTEEDRAQNRRVELTVVE